MATTRSRRTQPVEPVEPEIVADEPEAMVEVEEAIAAGEGVSLPANRHSGADTLYISPAPGYVFIKEGTHPEFGVEGDVRVGTVVLAGQDPMDQFYLPVNPFDAGAEMVPVVYNAVRSPQMVRGGSTYAVVKTEDILGLASADHTFAKRHSDAKSGITGRPSYQPDEDAFAYRSGSSSQTSPPSGSQASTFASASPFEPFTGG